METHTFHGAPAVHPRSIRPNSVTAPSLLQSPPAWLSWSASRFRRLPRGSQVKGRAGRAGGGVRHRWPRSTGEETLSHVCPHHGAGPSHQSLNKCVLSTDSTHSVPVLELGVWEDLRTFHPMRALCDRCAVIHSTHSSASPAETAAVVPTKPDPVGKTNLGSGLLVKSQHQLAEDMHHMCTHTYMHLPHMHTLIHTHMYILMHTCTHRCTQTWMHPKMKLLLLAPHILLRADTRGCELIQGSGGLFEQWPLRGDLRDEKEPARGDIKGTAKPEVPGAQKRRCRVV